MKYYRRICFVLLCSLPAACTNAPDKQPETPAIPVEERSTGQILYETQCTVCHGPDGTAGTGGAANLQQSRLSAPAVIYIITNGRRSMPAFKTKLSEDGIEQVADYIKTLRK